MTSQLYLIQGDIVSQLYGSNLDADPALSLPIMLERVFKLEQRLARWKRDLFPQLHQTPWEALEPESVSVSSFEPIFDKLSVITTLRYLNTRILLHRPILSSLLLQKVSRPRDNPFLLKIREQSIKTCEGCAMEVVDIVYKTSKSPFLLGAWWFSAYYSGSLSQSSSFPLTSFSSIQCRTGNIQLYPFENRYQKEFTNRTIGRSGVGRLDRSH